MNFHIDIVSLKGAIYSGDVTSVTVPGVEGDMTILARHMPFVTPLSVGEVVAMTPKGTLSLAIGKGIFEFSEGRGRLLIEDVAMGDYISEQKAVEAKKKAEDLLAKGIKGVERTAALYQLRRSLVDISIARRRRKKVF
ncbi:ATP synthase F1 subunit epsilon [Candidatus Woesebacteria bacterium RIFCSPLOWO2_01_FULL_39_23]|uniref:ATP synthase epsilon chain n=1 Tax=Candidatus Woesebacteria bacterium RIFCSPHIGHO2_01_FULL_40_22 TaxID=1802499 RepID=A0A1F7YLY8_9BACT|nr:MAG: ATP synthase F1 subunit epsilon [Candidatus Woesebacteria bacterium RBG_16_40_11]OGM27608.1 MAG: ATP synthase F1 subunit epsilon [Candidatus Woesebacteria bacterium RIFCSPHIGHO2_01_FULL_40_22]OGM36761.1 MAG: ATP synthase F1 subunit epsilon [Candidatus Woesebacteria bacterium RIFCSPHIGHO2_12_FULL_38_9]OGM62782.1 MAG: ATP synthase F1 subunit epsilon [Candidatus Woesebacteria bacterium RIFCSPLOWO2_01_FULL_39_23]